MSTPPSNQQLTFAVYTTVDKECRALQGWQMYSSSVTYLLQLWTRLVSCAAYLKSGQPNLLADLLPQIISAYVQCRLDSVQLVAQVRLPPACACTRMNAGEHALAAESGLCPGLRQRVDATCRCGMPM